MPLAEKKNKAKKRRKSKAKQYSLSHEKIKKAKNGKKPSDNCGKKFLRSSNPKRHTIKETNQIVFHKTRSTRSKSKNIKEDLMDKENDQDDSTDIFETF